MKDLVRLPGQMDLFALLNTGEIVVKTEVLSPSLPCKKVETVKSIEDYLQRGERIESLAKEWYSKKTEKMKLTSLDEYIAGELKADFEYPTWHSLHDALSKVFRGLLRKIEKCEKGDPYYDLLGEIGTPFSLSLIGGEGDENRSYSAAGKLRMSYQRSADQFILQGWYTNPDGEQRELVTLSYHTVKYTGQCYHWRDGSSVGRIEELLAIMYMVGKFNAAMDDKERRQELKSLFEDRRQQRANPGPRVMETMLIDSGINRIHRELPADKKLPEEVLKDPRLLVKEGAKFLVVDPEDYKAPTKEELKVFTDYMGLDPERIERVGRGELGDFKRFNQTEYVQSATKSSEPCRPFGWVITDDVCRQVVGQMDIFAAYDAGCVKAVFDDQIYWSHKYGCFFPQMSMNDCSVKFRTGDMARVLAATLEGQQSVVQTKRYYDELEAQRKSRAKAYQTKKNIPARTLKAMEESRLNEVFGYVEYDELVDLDKVQTLINQFLAFRDAYMPGFDTSNVQIRFRRLGNYKASGLYFPFHQCICVDVGKPDSFVHEYAHCLDYTLEKGKNLSDRAEFAAIKRLYGYHLKQALRKEKKKLSGKYDLSYYLTPTEIFARCFEIYAVRILKLDCSICKPDSAMGFAYPQDKELEELIAAYYGKLLVTVGKAGDPEKEESKAA